MKKRSKKNCEKLLIFLEKIKEEIEKPKK